MFNIHFHLFSTKLAVMAVKFMSEKKKPTDKNTTDIHSKVC